MLPSGDPAFATFRQGTGRVVFSSFWRHKPVGVVYGSFSSSCSTQQQRLHRRTVSLSLLRFPLGTVSTMGHRCHVGRICLLAAMLYTVTTFFTLSLCFRSSSFHSRAWWSRRGCASITWWIKWIFEGNLGGRHRRDLLLNLLVAVVHGTLVLAPVLKVCASASCASLDREIGLGVCFF